MGPPVLVLASASCRRRALLESCRIPFRVIVSAEPEDVSPEVAARGPDHVVGVLAVRKAEAVRRMLLAPQRGGEAPRDPWILGADTVVEVDDLTLGKPTDAIQARAMLERLSGKTHRVHTGIALIPGLAAEVETESVCTSVTFRLLSGADIAWYLGAAEWEGAAGAYRIQERAAFLVESIHGSYSNVVGLPLEAFYGMLVRHRYDFGGI